MLYLWSMRQPTSLQAASPTGNPSTSQAIPRCHRCHRSQAPHRPPLCERCESEYSLRRSSLDLAAWRSLGFVLVVPLILVVWSAQPPLNDLVPGIAWAHIWLLVLGGCAGWYVSQSIINARLLLFRHRFENENPPIRTRHANERSTMKFTRLSRIAVRNRRSCLADVGAATSLFAFTVATFTLFWML